MTIRAAKQARAESPSRTLECFRGFALVVTAAVVFTSTLLLIRDLDQPYDGINAREPAQTTYVRGQMLAEVVGGLPCGSRGLPTDAPLFRAQTAPRD